MKHILIIQTAYIGDVILATSLIESLIRKDASLKIDFLLRKGNEGLLDGHPHINELFVWDKNNRKYKNLFQTVKAIRKNKYDALLNLQRFASSGYFSWRAKAVVKVGFKQNPFSFSYKHKVRHKMEKGVHEIERNHALLKELGDFDLEKPVLYPYKTDLDKAREIAGEKKLIVMAPASVWFTKQLPKEKWITVIKQYSNAHRIVLIGGKNDEMYLQEILFSCPDNDIVNLAGELSLLESVALISLAEMTHANDSAPLHMASAVNAPITAYFCSTIPDFGFGPLSDEQQIKETTEELPCRPCGLHGKKACPEGHFKCALSVDVTIS
ncbi:MAG: glycosyltransferase family 9 protein [Crocinitomicaceae bacterium]